MFYYLSFLRPPPTSAAIGAPISLTPQVSNDLRTESYPEAVDIFCQWVDATSGTPLSSITKLTTWRDSNAYKEITLPPPPLRKAGQATLVLTPTPTPGTRELDLRSPGYGKQPLAVFSTPITFNSRLSGKASKQESIERVFRVLDSAENGSLRVKEMMSFDLDKVRGEDSASPVPC